MFYKIKKSLNKSNFKNKLKERKGMNSIETTIIVVILLIMIMTLLDLMEISQQLSATTSAINYTSRLICRQGGLTNSNSVSEDFEKYGHGSYVTTKSAYDIMNISLRKAYSYAYTDPHSVLGNEIKLLVTPYHYDGGIWKAQPTFELTRDSEFGVFIRGSHLIEGDGKMITQKQVLYHQVYYLLQAQMSYEAFTIEKLFLLSDSYFTQSEGVKTYTKTFSRFVIPSYYNREYSSEQEYKDNVDNKDEWYVH